MKKILLSLWLAAWAILIFTFAVLIQKRDSDVVIFFGMLTLTFPSGLIVVWSLQTLASLGIALPNGVLGQYMGLAIFILAGYCQWFVLMPSLVRLFHRTKSDTSGGDPPKEVSAINDRCG